MLAHFKVPLSWGELAKRTINESIADDILNLAAQQAYYFFLALFPALLALISIASFFPIENLMDEVVVMLDRIAPKEVIEIVRVQLQKIANTDAGGLFTLAFLFTIWSSSAAVLSMCSTLNAAYDITESRPWWKVRLVALGLTVGLAIFILVSMTLVVAGPALAEGIATKVGLGPAFKWTWLALQWPLVFALVASAIAMVYYFAPDAEQDWVWITPGSVVATLLWILISLGFRFYVTNFGSYNETYGAIAGVAILMLWFYFSGIAILLGAELNAEIEHASPYGKDVGEKVPGEKKKIGIAARRAWEERREKGEMPATVFSDDANCDLERAPARAAAPKEKRLRPSDVLIGTAALIPAAVKVAREVKKKVDERKDERKIDERAA